MSTKMCSYCGQEKSLDDFRDYYDGRKGKYTFCKECERIESRRKYLMRRGDACTPEQKQELEDIAALYKARAAHGLNAPGLKRPKVTVADLVERQLNNLS